MLPTTPPTSPTPPAPPPRPQRGRVAAHAAALLALIALGAMAQPAGSPEPAMPTHVPDSAAPAAGPSTLPEVTVALRDGLTLRGLLVSETEERVVIRIAGIDTPYARDRLLSLVPLPPVEERFQELLATLPPDDAAGRLYLAEWLLARERYVLALEMASEAISIDPGLQRARDLHTWLSEHITLLSLQGRAGEEAARSRPRPRDQAPDFPRLTPRDINLIRVFEFDFAEPSRLRIQSETMRRLLDRYVGHEALPATPEARAELLRAPDIEQLETLFRVQARDLYPEVEVLTNPPAVRRFRDDVHRAWLLNSCAASKCHGGEDAGRFVLLDRAPQSDETIYTNLYIVDRFRLDDGSPLIDYQRPLLSPLIQLGLPRDASQRPHPIVGEAGRRERWSPAFDGPTDKAVEEAIEWIESMFQPRPDYGLVYTPIRPFERPTDPTPAPAGPPR